MKTNKYKPTRKAKGKTAATKAAPTTGESTAVSEYPGDQAAPATKVTNHQQKLIDQGSSGPALGLVITDTDILPTDEPYAGQPNTEPLTAQERLDLRRCEIVIEENMNAWLEIAAALSEISAKRLYREHYRSFKEYLAKKWNIGPAHGYRLIEAHETLKQLSPMGDSSILPANERQLRELAKVPEGRRAEVLKGAQKKAGNGKMTSRHIKEAAQEIKAGITVQNATSAPPTGETPNSNTANITTPAKVCHDAKILPLGELSRMADTLHDIFLNPSRHGEAVELLLKLKVQLSLYAEWEAQDLGEAQLKKSA